MKTIEEILMEEDDEIKVTRWIARKTDWDLKKKTAVSTAWRARKGLDLKTPKKKWTKQDRLIVAMIKRKMLSPLDFVDRDGWRGTDSFSKLEARFHNFDRLELGNEQRNICKADAKLWKKISSMSDDSLYAYYIRKCG